MPDIREVSFGDTIINEVGVQARQIKVCNRLYEQEQEDADDNCSIWLEVVPENSNEHLMIMALPHGRREQLTVTLSYLTGETIPSYT